MTTVYEWVVEEMDGTVPEADIIDCNYTTSQTEALKWRNALIAEGKPVSFGLCKSVYDSEADGGDMTHRTYAYVDDAGKLPVLFDDGSAVPKRFL